MAVSNEVGVANGSRFIILAKYLFQRKKIFDVIRTFTSYLGGCRIVPAQGCIAEEKAFGRVGQHVLYRVPHIIYVVDDQPVKDDAQHNHAQQGKIAFPLDDKPNIGQDKEGKQREGAPVIDGIGK